MRRVTMWLKLGNAEIQLKAPEKLSKLTLSLNYFAQCLPACVDIKIWLKKCFFSWVYSELSLISTYYSLRHYSSCRCFFCVCPPLICLCLKPSMSAGALGIMPIDGLLLPPAAPVLTTQDASISELESAERAWGCSLIFTSLQTRQTPQHKHVI